MAWTAAAEDQKAIIRLLSSIESAETLPESKEKTTLLMSAHANLGNVFVRTGDLEQAIEHHKMQYNLASELNDADALARASHNLQNDHNSAKQYDVAHLFRAPKATLSSSKQDTSIMIGNLVQPTIPQQASRSGWIVKHKGGDASMPSKMRNNNKCLLVYDNYVLAYYRDAQAKRAQRYIPIKDILKVDRWGQGKTNSLCNMRIVTPSRAFYFTCETSQEAEAWIATLTAAAAQFGEGVRELAPKMAILGLDEERVSQNPAFNDTDDQGL
jgi:hypothetical protein